LRLSPGYRYSLGHLFLLAMFVVQASALLSLLLLVALVVQYSASSLLKDTWVSALPRASCARGSVQW
jgi:hypothetical protein